MPKARPLPDTVPVENRLRVLRQARGLSQVALAERTGVTRQAIYAIEMNEYLPSTGVALRLADTLACRVEDLFSLASAGTTVQGELVGSPRPASGPRAGERAGTRVKVARIGARLVVRPVAALGDVLNFTIGADGLLAGPVSSSRTGGNRVTVRLLRDRRAIEEEVVVAGCDPSIFLIGQHLGPRRSLTEVVAWSMGSGAALNALRRGEVHVAGLHVVDAKSGEYNLPYLRRHWRGPEIKVITFASWQQGIMVQPGNPKRIRTVEDFARRDVSIVNREEGAGARLLLDERLAAAGMRAGRVRGYRQMVSSHIEVARMVAERRVDAGLGIEAAARLTGLDFIPIQTERYDLVIPAAFLQSHAGLSRFLDAIVTGSFRAELQALGGYDTRETGRAVESSSLG